MLVERMRRSFFLVLLLIPLLLFTGCGDGEVVVPSDENGIESPPVTEEVEREAAERVPSDLWAPPVAAYGNPDRLPRAGEVPYPLYPGAEAFGYTEPQGGRLAYIFLLSPDPMDSVYAFYKEHLGHLEGWQTRESADAYEIWQGDAGKVIDAYGYLIPAVLIGAPLDASLMPGAQSKIIVVYQPN